MRVVTYLHTPDSPLTAVGLFFRRMAEHFKARGDSFTIVAPQSSPVLRRIPHRFYVGLMPFYVAADLRRRRGTVDLAIFHSYTGWVAHACSRAARRPWATATSFHGLEPLHYEEVVRTHRALGHPLSRRYRIVYGALMPRVLKFTCRRSDGVVCQTKEEIAYVERHGWVPTARLLRIEAGVEDAFFVRDRVYAPRARRLLMVSQWQQHKGVQYLAEAFTTLVREGHDLELTCAGTRQPDEVVLGAFPADVRSRVVNRADVPHADMPAFYRDADVFIHPSLKEGSSHAQLEAMASALPMIVTATAPAIDLLVPGDGFLLVEKRSGDAIAAAIRQLVDDAASRSRLGRRAQDAAATARLEDNLERFHRFFSDLVAARAARCARSN